ncbi:GNAT family N-acetyltransferase [Rhizobium sp. XQZ8]|uniref:GNAT family N-acetyltransferase n=1 Tax=Rhizobium populisoli TaxID=2859785 RepID=UPI001C67620D|nr:GNAT family N-acetyltransferase [Rhizobium populisoli]MBW6423413.1 GNAT family N-acetyltransferase [Rhizobium populisoli]
MTEAKIIDIGRADTAWHDRFFRHAADIFGGIDFSRWASLGGWNENYRVLAVVEEEELVATVGVTRMQLSLMRDEPTSARNGLIEGFQLGAVATRKDRRGEGFARRLIDRVLASTDASGAPALLFANSSVVDFYPKFGFRRLLPQRLSAETAIAPGDDPARHLDVTQSADRDLLARFCASSPVNGGALSARPDPSTLLWYLCNGFTRAHVLQDGKSIAFVEQDDDRLVLQEWLGASPADIAAALSLVVTKPVGLVEFGFLPPQSWTAQPLAIEDDPKALMFWRGPDLPAGNICFPALMHT